MITREMIGRINELAKRQRTTGLTEAEKDEQALLRRQYIDNIKDQVRNQLDGAGLSHEHDGSCGCGHKH